MFKKIIITTFASSLFCLNAYAISFAAKIVSKEADNFLGVKLSKLAIESGSNIGSDAGSSLSKNIREATMAIYRLLNPNVAPMELFKMADDITGTLKIARSRTKDTTLQKTIDDALAILNKDADKVTDKEIVDFSNKLNTVVSKFSNRTGTYLMCSSCVDSTLAGIGVKYVVKGVKNTNIVNLLKDTIPSSGKQLDSFLKGLMAKHKISTSYTDMIKLSDEVDKKNFALFLKLYGESSDRFRELGDAIFAVTKKTSSGKYSFFSSKDPNKLWRIYNTYYDSSYNLGKQELFEEMEAITRVINSAAKSKGTKSTEQAFYDSVANTFKDANALEKRVASKNLDELKKQRCFFR